jgi:hypothetical protein
MPTDPFVAPTLDDTPRQQRNLAPGVTMPAARPWRADRPGDLQGSQPTGELLGAPGPNIGYALTLVDRARDRLALAPHEHADDARAVVGELAMKRAASYGRAPVMADVDVAMLLLGYQGGCAPEFAEWRAVAVSGAHEAYPRRRAFCDAGDLDVLRLDPATLVPRIGDVRAGVRAAVTRELAARELAT